MSAGRGPSRRHARPSAWLWPPIFHDFVAHEISAIVVQARAGRVVGVRDLAQAIAALDWVEEAGVRALESMDRAVQTLHDEGEPGAPRRTYGLDDLAEAH